MAGAAQRGFFTASTSWCRAAALRFALREGGAVGEQEIAAIQHDVTLRLWRFLATVARRAATLNSPSLRLVAGARFEDDVARAIGERLGFEMPEDRDLLDRLAVEFQSWLAAEEKGRRATPWGALEVRGNETSLEVVPATAASSPDSPAAAWEIRTPRRAAREISREEQGVAVAHPHLHERAGK
jgi:hypothetical protein